MTARNLFRGLALGPKLEILANERLRVTLDVQDYNALFPLVAVGAPDGGSAIDQADGTTLAVDPLALNYSIQHTLGPGYWPSGGVLAVDWDTFFLADEPPGVPVVDWETAMSDLGAFLTELTKRVNAGAHYWMTWPDFGGWPIDSGPALQFHWRSLTMTDAALQGFGTADQQYAMGFPAQTPADVIAAPYELDRDAGWAGDVADMPAGVALQPAALDVAYDWSKLRSRAYVRGGTPVPVNGSQGGSGWVSGGHGIVVPTDVYVDAPGVLDKATRDMVGHWHLDREFIELMTGAAHVQPGYDGWRVGQTVLITSKTLGRFYAHPLFRRPTIIQSVRGKMVAPAPAISVYVNGVDMSTKVVEWTSLAFEEVLGSPGKATVVFEVALSPDWDDETVYAIGDRVHYGTYQCRALATGAGHSPATAPDAWWTLDPDLFIEKGADILICSDGCAIEYDLEFGDVPAGSLAAEVAKPKVEAPKGPAYKFSDPKVEDPAMPVGGHCLVTTQAADMSGAGFAVSDLPMEWILLQWADEAGTEPGTGYALGDDSGPATPVDGIYLGTNTDNGGMTSITLWRDEGTSIKYQITAVALPEGG
jgi:hypothetical protein